MDAGLITLNSHSLPLFSIFNIWFEGTIAK